MQKQINQAIITEKQINQLVENCKGLDLTQEIGNDIEITEDWEIIIEKIILFKKFLKEIEEVIDEKLMETVKKNPDKLGYEGSRVKLLYYPRTTYKVDKESVDEKYTVIDKKPNKKTIEAFFNLYQKLPKGVIKDISYSISKKLI